MGKFRRDTKPLTVGKTAKQASLLKLKPSSTKIQKILPTLALAINSTTTVAPKKAKIIPSSLPKAIPTSKHVSPPVASRKSLSTIKTPRLKKQQKLQQKRSNLIETIKQKLAKPMKRKLKPKQKKAKNSTSRMMEFSALKNILSELDDCITLLPPKSKISKKVVQCEPGSLVKIKPPSPIKTSTTEIEPKEMSKSKMVRKNRQKKKKEFMDRCNYLEKLMGDKKFLKNPRDVIRQHIENKFFESK